MGANGDPLRPSPVVPSRIRFRVLGFACSLSLITYLDRICIMRARSDIQNDLGFSTTQMGWVFAAFLVGYTLFEVPGGWMGDRWGSRRALVRIVLCWSAFTALTGCIWSFRLDSGLVASLGSTHVPLVVDALGVMLLVRFLFGAGEAGAYPNLTRLVSDWFPFRERAFAQGGIWMSARLGGAIAPLVLGRLAALIGWRQAFWVLGGVGLVWAWFFWRRFRDRPEQHPECNDAERRLVSGQEERAPGPAAVGPAVPLPASSALLSAVSIVAVCSASFWVCFGWYFYPTWQPLYLEEVHAYRPDGWQSELLSGAPFLCGALGSLIGGGLSDRLVPLVGKRWGRSLIGLAGFGGAGLCVLGTGFATSTVGAVALLCLAFLVNDLAIPVIWATCADIGGRFVGTLAGLMNSVGGIGAFLSPLLIPYVLVWLPETLSAGQRWRIIFMGLAGAWFLAALAWLFIDAGRPLGAAAGARPAEDGGEPGGLLPRTDGVRPSG